MSHYRYNNRYATMPEIKRCIRFYEKRHWNWIGVVGYLCHCALNDSMQREAEAMAEAIKGTKYKVKP